MIKNKYNIGDKILFITENYMSSELSAIREGIVSSINFNTDLNVVCYDITTLKGEKFEYSIPEHKIIIDGEREEQTMMYIVDDYIPNIPVVDFDINVDRVFNKFGETDIHSTEDIMIIIPSYTEIIHWLLENVKDNNILREKLEQLCLFN